MWEYRGVPENNDYLEHYGVLGMKWGVRRARRTLSRNPSEKKRKKAMERLGRIKSEADQRDSAAAISGKRKMDKVKAYEVTMKKKDAYIKKALDAEKRGDIKARDRYGAEALRMLGMIPNVTKKDRDTSKELKTHTQMDKILKDINEIEKKYGKSIAAQNANNTVKKRADILASKALAAHDRGDMDAYFDYLDEIDKVMGDIELPLTKTNKKRKKRKAL